MCKGLITWLKGPIIKPTPVPVGETIELIREHFIQICRKHGVDSLTGSTPIDRITRIASKAELDKIARELVYPGDWYAEDIFDCDDYALQAQLDAGRKFEITVRLGLGMTNYGYHAFALTLDTDYNLWWLEPNAGFPWAGEWCSSGEYSYKPDKVFI